MAECKCDDWMAVHDHMPPGPATLRVTASCTCPPGRTLELRRKEPQGINPRDLLLELVEIEQEGGGYGGGGSDETADLEYREDTDVEYDTVSILPDGP
ncbi:MAG TPA: hypothetical protein VF715_01165, partial [Thermoleophilaceae bacterium]